MEYIANGQHNGPIDSYIKRGVLSKGSNVSLFCRFGVAMIRLFGFAFGVWGVLAITFHILFSDFVQPVSGVDNSDNRLAHERGCRLVGTHEPYIFVAIVAVERAMHHKNYTNNSCLLIL